LLRRFVPSFPLQGALSPPRAGIKPAERFLELLQRNEAGELDVAIWFEFDRPGSSLWELLGEPRA
jgi:hypothetical protein